MPSHLSALSISQYLYMIFDEESELYDASLRRINDELHGGRPRRSHLDFSDRGGWMDRYFGSEYLFTTEAHILPLKELRRQAGKVAKLQERRQKGPVSRGDGERRHLESIHSSLITSESESNDTLKQDDRYHKQCPVQPRTVRWLLIHLMPQFPPKDSKDESVSESLLHPSSTPSTAPRPQMARKNRWLFEPICPMWHRHRF